MFVRGLHVLPFTSQKETGSPIETHTPDRARLTSSVPFDALAFVDLTVVGNHRVDWERKGDRAHEMLQHFFLFGTPSLKRDLYQTNVAPSR